jgi:sigma-B regulation protein RsbQ
VATSTRGTGSTVTIIIVGPMIGRAVAADRGDDRAAQIEELLQFLESNHMGWSAQTAIMGNPRTGPNSGRS